MLCSMKQSWPLGFRLLVPKFPKSHQFLRFSKSIILPFSPNFIGYRYTYVHTYAHIDPYSHSYRFISIYVLHQLHKIWGKVLALHGNWDHYHQKKSRHQISRVLDQLGFGTEKKWENKIKWNKQKKCNKMKKMTKMNKNEKNEHTQ